MISTSKCSIAITHPLIFIEDDRAYQQGCQLQPTEFSYGGNITYLRSGRKAANI
jgi:hypothetical protein